MAVTQKAKDNAYISLYKAVAKYVRLQGGTVILCEGIQVQIWPKSREDSFTVGVKCIGSMPVFAKKEAPHA
jgi:hypothetical protein